MDQLPGFSYGFDLNFYRNADVEYVSALVKGGKSPKGATEGTERHFSRKSTLRELKEVAPIKWVQLENSCKAQAEEIIQYELIYSI